MIDPDKVIPEVPFRFRNPAMKIKFNGMIIDLYAASVFRSIIHKSYRQHVAAEKAGKLPRPMFVDKNTGRRYYTVWELAATSELVRRNGIPNFSGVGSIFGRKLDEAWRKVRDDLSAGVEPEFPISVSYPNRAALENDLANILQGFVEGTGSIRKIANRIIERHVNSKGF